MEYLLGYCVWLLTGSLEDRVRFVAAQEYDSVALLQSVMDLPRAEKEKAAHAIRETGLRVTFHGNVHAALKDGRLDPAFATRLFEEVFWWHENTNGVFSCCSDPITTDRGQTRVFLREDTLALFRMAAEAFASRGIRYGIENIFRFPHIAEDGETYASIESFEWMRTQLGESKGAGMLFDAAHANVWLHTESKDSMAAYMKTIPFDIHEVHISDNRGEKDEHLAPGCGTLDFDGLKAGLLAKNFSGVISMELCKDILNGLYAYDIFHPDECDYVKTAMANMRSIFQNVQKTAETANGLRPPATPI